jgi:hypothetical protein
MDRYPALAFIVGVTNLLAIGVAGLLGVFGLVALFGGRGGFLVALALWVTAVLVWIYIKASAELIQVFVRIEENTRHQS